MLEYLLYPFIRILPPCSLQAPSQTFALDKGLSGDSNFNLDSGFNIDDDLLDHLGRRVQTVPS